ncbi:hypothetical protein K2173_010634 [Erythroxylum novogranatense]|uniref:Fe-S metabolism associated domain-containing protein n=1 Tax=Erythroxylum novogranatense TaxID=1862640 RepID=A0AAV8TFW0_9ROSI|nr:hypothetical protein K2173_010634 [Erythroxylum novogranatense]
MSDSPSISLGMAASSASSSMTTSLRLFTSKAPYSFHSSKTLISSMNPTKFPFSIFLKSVSFQKIPTKKLPTLTVPTSASASNSVSSQPVEELPPKLQEIVKLFQSVQEPKAKYEQLLFYGKNLKPLETQFKTRENKVEGCVSQVWVRAYLDGDKTVVFEADSDSVLTKGLAALLVQGLSGRPVEEVLRVSPDFAVLLGLQQSLTPSRNNGFLNMLKLMQRKALELYLLAQKGSGSDHNLNLDEGDSPGELKRSNLGLQDGGGIDDSSSGLSYGKDLMPNGNSGSKTGGSADLESQASEMDLNLRDLGSRGIRIREKLSSELNPIELLVEDISYQHAGHAGVRGSDGETHFNLKVISKEFEGKSLVKRHRLIYNLLQEELQSGLHALSIIAKTPAELDRE